MDTPHTASEEKKPRQQAAMINTGAALASAAAFSVVGAMLGKTIGSYGDSVRHKLSSGIGKWVGGVSFAILSLYATMKAEASRQAQMQDLEKENDALRREIAQAKLPQKTDAPMQAMPVIERAAHEGTAAPQPEISSPQKS